VSDTGGYLKALGTGRIAEVKRDARMGKAIATMKANIREAEAEQKRMQSKFENETNVALAKRQFDLRKAENDRGLHL